MNNDKFLKNSILLTLSNSTTGILKFVFSIILSRELGAEGMGLYALIMPIYDLFCCLVCGGMVTALSKQASSFYTKHDCKNLHKCIHVTIIFDLIWTIFIAVFVSLNSNYIGLKIIKDSRSIHSLILICIALIFVALSSIIKGYFYGISNVTTPSIIDIFEKFIRILVTILVIKLLPVKEIEYTVTAVYAALAAGEFVSFLLLYIFYRHSKTKDFSNHCKDYPMEASPQLLFDILFMAVPLCVNGFLTTAISTVSTLILPRRLLLAGFSHTTSLGMIGKFSGMALTIIFFPLVVITSMSIVLIPDIAETVERKDYMVLEERLKQVIKISFLIGISTLIICFSISTPLGKLLFARDDLGTYIKFAAISAPFTYVSSTTFSILNGLGKQGVLLRNSLIVAIEELVLLYVLTSIPSINILGYGLSLLITSITSLIMNMHEIKKKCYMEFSLGNIIIDILLSLLIYFIINIMNNIIPNTLFKLKISTIIILGFILFFSINFILDKTIKSN
ncbi:stage V sporulation protein B [Clostridium botulinum]|uniref:Multidrug-efflux transporter n=1 Tax=Clostridium botulinum TaxID=1491 RepID=A0A9Q1ZBX7_CLOBO|nr:stage V sporulation protein B [Clostridium botulinum]AEB75498.1 stage V sporulation protein B [Clostridium botulinum BKT015925]KEH99630.1 sporulation protein SpoVB [Clostridium botulinum D str. 16868]KEI04366.1 sporulation protein SpoVB [Clostridium botulinum C/D str. Sp77]KLU74783.1 sporulation protein SpoVB [Clostridium botulinum V891]KOA78347.1 sporulation protein SpoVB [Clostridium botulinum]